jgi:L-ascorbate 6-phosphate lactonase
VIGSTLRSRSLEEKVQIQSRFMKQFCPQLEAITIRPVIGSLYPIQQAEEAHRSMAENLNIGKVVLKVRGARSLTPRRQDGTLPVTVIRHLIVRQVLLRHRAYGSGYGHGGLPRAGRIPAGARHSFRLLEATMSTSLAAQIRDLQVGPGSLAIFWLAQAGFVYKTPAGTIVYVDAYLSDCVHRMLKDEMYGFKRIMPSPIAPEDVDADLVVCTHSHPDHFDYDAIPVLARNPRIHFAAAPDCRAEFEKLGVPAEKYTIIHEGQTLTCNDVQVTGVYADHGELAPDALGVLLRTGGIKVWQVADTAYRPERWQDLFALGLDVIIPPINGAFGNLDGVEAARLAGDAHARVAIPCHFWMFAEHGGNPAQFLDACKQYAPGTEARLMSQGELWVCRK